MNALAEVLVVNTAVAAAVGLVAWLVLLACRRPAVAHLLFLVAMLKLLAPPLIPLPLLVGAADPPRPLPAVPAVSAAQPDVVPNGLLPAPPVLATAPVRLGPPVREWSWSLLLVAGWAAGSLCVAGAAAWRLRTFHRALAAMRPAPASLEADVAALLPRFGLRRAPRLRIVDADVSPAVVLARGGAWLLFPAPLLRELSAAECRTLLAHELAHVRRRDPWLRAIELAATVVLWWLPVLWWLRAGLRAAEERSCDAWVAAVVADGRRDYCRALLRAGRSRPVPLPALASGIGRIRRWQDRLEDIMCRDIPHLPSAAARALTLALAIGMLPLALAQGPPAAVDLPAKLAIPVQTDLTRATLEEWTSWLARATGIGFEVTDAARRADAAQTTLIGVRLPSMPARRVLNVIAEITGLSWMTVGDRVVVDLRKAVDGNLRVDTFAAGAPVVWLFGSLSRHGAIPWPEDATLMQIVRLAAPTDEADLTRVQLISPDGEHPLVVEVDFRQMVLTGNTAQNVMVRAGDILFVPKRSLQLPPLRLAPGSRLQFVFDPKILTLSGLEQLAVLSEPQTVGRDGTILVPLVGYVNVLDKTQDEVTRLVTDLYHPLFKVEVRPYARFLPDR
jgi:beta-lactamase regulating signal transducer with metallopeptidase domain